MTKRFICFGGYIISQNDGERHYISARKVAELYRVRSEECYFVDKQEREVLFGVARQGALRELYPREDGNYSLQD